MRNTLHLMTLLIVFSAACSKRNVSTIEVAEDCGQFIEGPVQEPLLNVVWFSKELSEFNRNNKSDYQVLYIFSPGDDSYGSLLFCKIDGDSASILKSSVNKTMNNFEATRIKQLLNDTEHGGFYILCNKPNENHYYLAMIKQRDSVIFQYQSMNYDLFAIRPESMKNSVNLYKFLQSK